MRLRVAIALVLAGLGSAFTAGWAHAAFPGENGKIATGERFDGIGTRNPDGTGHTEVTFLGGLDEAPAWSPDGTRLAFHRWVHQEGDVLVGMDLYTVNSDGSGQVKRLGNVPGDQGGGDYYTMPAWSPDGSKLAFAYRSERSTPALSPDGIHTYTFNGSVTTPVTAGGDAPAWSPDGATIAFDCGQICVVEPDGTDRTTITSIAGDQPDWSPDGARIVFTHRTCSTCPGDIYVVDRDGGNPTQLTATTANETEAVFSPDGTRILYVKDPTISANGGVLHTMNPDGTDDATLPISGVNDPDWQPLPVGYPRPRSASPLYLSLVPYSQPCTAPNREHGPPLAHPSCAPPAPGSNNLTVGVGDGHPALSRSTGFVRFKALVGDPGGVDDSDVRLRLNLTNVMWASDLSEYAGELLVRYDLRITDRFNTPDPAGSGPGTVINLSSTFKAQCTPTAAELEKSVCDVLTSMDALIPGAIPEGKRTVWQVGSVVVFDGGPDGDVDTNPNRPFATQGVFVP